ncbi:MULTISPECIES: hypothetical protein [Peptoniphilus]|uniref:Uncharacterized protein n=2 Tax=Peptoniphilus TaxID=162289 RepID=E0NMS6_9FIRM|nr:MULTISPECIES: hypothetical protein [Peptoniphilus]EFM24894.1 hypothetical protein HMPREF9225_1465 [Peptoniphilus duerdenii ATCC BAA-1640]ERT63340.1 hypothetical protein HMPREF1252_1171 [Peptoniphilus sp. BV3AC2]MDK8275947.1 hypothetical protein [Peptoniphilus duerdenii]
MLPAKSNNIIGKRKLKVYKNYCFEDVKDFLLDKFLLDGDVDSMNILLNSYNIEDSINTITPSYISLKHLKKDLVSFLKHKEGKELLAYNISSVIHDDINKFELAMYLEGYRAGFNSKVHVDMVESLAFSIYDLNKIYTCKKLFKSSVLPEEVQKIKDRVFLDVEKLPYPKKKIKDIVKKLDFKLLRKKIYMMNSFLDKQLMFSENPEEGFIELGNALTRNELLGLNKKIIKFMLRDGLRVYKNSFWDGVNDRVLKRYK